MKAISEIRTAEMKREIYEVVAMPGASSKASMVAARVVRSTPVKTARPGPSCSGDQRRVSKLTGLDGYKPTLSMVMLSEGRSVVTV